MTEEYFRLFQSRQVSNPIVIQNLASDYYPIKMTPATFDQLEDMVFAGYRPDALGLEICDLLSSPCFLISDKLKHVFSLLAPGLRFKGISLVPLGVANERILDYPAPLYWLPYSEPADCLHSTAQRYDTGVIKELVLQADAINGKHILRVSGPGQEFWLVSLTAAENILKLRPLAVGLERVPVRE